MTLVAESKKGFLFGKLFYGWVVVSAAWLMGLACGGSSRGAFPVFLDALLDQFGWSRASLALGFSLHVVVSALAGVVAGVLMDRVGPRRMVAMGAIVGGISLFLVGLTRTPWHFYLSYGFLLPFGWSMTVGIPTTATVRRWFTKRAASAASIAATGMALGATVFPQVAYLFIENLGWQNAFRLMAVIFVSGGIVGALLLKRDPESAGTHPDGIPITEQKIKVRADIAARSVSWSVREVLTARAFWFYMLAQSGLMITAFALHAHLKVWAYKDLGAGETFAVSMVSLLWGSVAVSRLLGGFVSDLLLARFGRKPVLYFCTLGVTASLFYMLTISSPSQLALAVAVLGLSYGSGTGVFSAYLGDLFGVASLPVIVGLAGIESQLGAALGPWYFGEIRDRMGSYDLAFIITGIISAISVLCLLLLRPPKKKPAS